MTNAVKTLVAIPVYNEEHYVDRVIPRVLEHATDVLVVDDASPDGTAELAFSGELADTTVELVEIVPPSVATEPCTTSASRTFREP